MTRHISRYLVMALLAAGCGGKKDPLAIPARPLDTKDKASFYAAGIKLGEGVHFTLYPTADEMTYVVKGLIDAGLVRKRQLDIKQWDGKVEAFADARVKALADKEKERAKPILSAAAEAPQAIVFPSGVVFRSLQEGHGVKPSDTDTVKVNFTALLIDGKLYDSSEKRGGPTELELAKIPQCWSEALLHMKLGEQARVVCPSSTVYGDAGFPPYILPGSALVMDKLELLEIVAPPHKTTSAPQSEHAHSG